MVAARASAGAARKGPRRSLRALDRTDRRRQDAGGFPADAGGAVFSRSSGSPPSAKRRGGLPCRRGWRWPRARGRAPALRGGGGRGGGWGVSPLALILTLRVLKHP